MIQNCGRAIFFYGTFKDKTDSERDVTIMTKITIDRLFDKHFQCSDCKVLFFGGSTYVSVSQLTNDVQKTNAERTHFSPQLLSKKKRE